jgi:cytosine/creatinine deaminase
VPNLLITNVLVPTGLRRDVLIEDGVIRQITDHIVPPSGSEQLDGTGQVLLPGFVDAHSHLDKSLLGRPWYGYAPRSLSQMLADERGLRSSPEWDYAAQIGNNAEVLVANGATHTRAFVDIDTEVGLAGLEGMLAVQTTFASALTMQIVAFAQSGMAGRPGTEQLLDDALAAGADIVGGIDPSLVERDPVRHLDLIFALAEKHGAGVDVHLHESGPLGAHSASLIVERAKVHDLPRPVVISHPDFLGGISGLQAGQLIEAMVEAGVAVTTCVPSGEPKPPLKTMLEAGLLVGVGCDGERDSWAPLGHSDMLLRAYLMAWRYGFGTDADLEIPLDLISAGGARVMGLPDHDVKEGSRADLVLLPGEVKVEPIVALPRDRTVIKGGHIVARGGHLIGSR